MSTQRLAHTTFKFWFNKTRLCAFYEGLYDITEMLLIDRINAPH